MPFFERRFLKFRESNQTYSNGNVRKFRYVLDELAQWILEFVLGFIVIAIDNRSDKYNIGNRTIGYFATYSYWCAMFFLSMGAINFSFNGKYGIVVNLFGLISLIISSILDSILIRRRFVDDPKQKLPTAFLDNLNWIAPTAVIVSWIAAIAYRLAASPQSIVLSAFATAAILVTAVKLGRRSRRT